MNLSQYEQVRLFTRESMGPLPDKPSPLTLDQAKFLFKMKFSEAAEFFTSYSLTKEEIANVLHDCIDEGMKDLREWEQCKNEVEQISRQVDSLIDDDYYTKNAAAKHAFPMDECFEEVQRANMDKRFPDGTFHKRDDGKVIKPDTWVERDLNPIILKKM